mmetsp:Transcript_66384/g.74362  ORF Transcript_66384/g.74362 Transcript_66384/m.74362 type:complete len:97 (-) Transcript_66384:572-862(-)
MDFVSAMVVLAPLGKVSMVIRVPLDKRIINDHDDDDDDDDSESGNHHHRHSTNPMISLSTEALEPKPGDMLCDPQRVFAKAQETLASKFYASHILR